MEACNICRFIPAHNDHDMIHTINFVLETKPQQYEGLISNSVFRMHYIVEGDGFLHTPGKVQPLKRGDIFFVLPAVPYAIASGTNLKYMYISYLGGRANRIMDRLKVGSQNLLFHDFEEVEAFWTDSLKAAPTMLDLRSESVLLYTFSVMGTRFLAEEEKTQKASTTVSLIKKYIDDNYADCELTLEKIGKELSYNKKYLSVAFKEKYQIGVSEYINTVRIQHACTLMEQGFTSMKDIAQLCGYKDPLYFSRVFKKKMGVAPREHVEEITKKP